MADKKPQSFANHSRFDLLFHAFVLPIFIGNAIWSVVHFIRFPGVLSGWMFVVSAGAAVAVVKIRTYSLKVQDRVIRLEERLRLTGLLSEPLKSRIPELTLGQLVGLRFASDAEVPGLVSRTLQENLSRADIKNAIQTWRPDDLRV